MLVVVEVISDLDGARQWFGSHHMTSRDCIMCLIELPCTCSIVSGLPVDRTGLNRAPCALLPNRSSSSPPVLSAACSSPLPALSMWLFELAMATQAARGATTTGGGGGPTTTRRRRRTRDCPPASQLASGRASESWCGRHQSQAFVRVCRPRSIPCAEELLSSFFSEILAMENEIVNFNFFLKFLKFQVEDSRFVLLSVAGSAPYAD